MHAAMKRLKGMRAVTEQSNALAPGEYLQISLDMSDGEILGVVLAGRASDAWQPYQGPWIVPVMNTDERLSMREVTLAAESTRARRLQEPDTWITREQFHQSVKQAYEEAHEAHEKTNEQEKAAVKRLYDAGLIDIEEFLGGNGMISPFIKPDDVRYCADCRSTTCTNWRHDQFGVDAPMVPILRVLHTKGYRTVFCCAGHAEEQGRQYDTHVDIAGDLNVPPPVGFECSIPNYGYQPRIRIAAAAPRDAWKRKELLVTAQQRVDENLASLQAWADALPPAQHGKR